MPETYLFPPNQPPPRCPKCDGKDIQSDQDEYPTLTHDIKSYLCLNEDCEFEWEETFVFQSWQPKED